MTAPAPAPDRLDKELATVRTELGRADSKAGALLGLCTGVLGVGIAVLAAGGHPPQAAVAGWTGALAVGGAVVLLVLAGRPRLGGRFGFCRWATASPHEVLSALAGGDRAVQRARAEELIWLSRAVSAKYGQVRAAGSLLLLGLGWGAVAAALSALLR